jgi:hypothetical protein
MDLTPEDTLNELATDATGVTPTKVEVLAMRRLIEYGIEEARNRGEEGVLDAGLDFARHYEDVEVTVGEVNLFQREWLEEE